MDPVKIERVDLATLSHEELHLLHKALIRGKKALTGYHKEVSERLAAHNEVRHARRAAGKLTPRQRAAMAAVLAQAEAEANGERKGEGGGK